MKSSLIFLTLSSLFAVSFALGDETVEQNKPITDSTAQNQEMPKLTPEQEAMEAEFSAALATGDKEQIDAVIKKFFGDDFMKMFEGMDMEGAGNSGEEEVKQDL